VPMHCEECCRGERNFRILDTHGGSMSSAIACHMEGFDLDICELDEDYFNDAVKRFKLNTIQEKLF
jgi:site-specific DNA-methyltransferase (adenine-specific)